MIDARSSPAASGSTADMIPPLFINCSAGTLVAFTGHARREARHSARATSDRVAVMYRFGPRLHQSN